MKQVRFLRTSCGDYGTKTAGDETLLKDALAEDLASKGAVLILADAGEDIGETNKPRSSVRITDHTSKVIEREEEANPYDPTNTAKNRASN